MRDTIIAIHHQKEIGSPDFVFPLTFDLEREGEQWTGTCLEFGTSTFGDTLDEVRKELQEAVQLQLNEAERLGMRAALASAACQPSTSTVSAQARLEEASRHAPPAPVYNGAGTPPVVQLTGVICRRRHLQFLCALG